MNILAHGSLLTAGIPAILICLALLPHRAVADGPLAIVEARQFIAEYEANVRPLRIAAARADWKANASGNDHDYEASEAAENALDAALADKARFAKLKVIRQDLRKPDVKSDPLLTRPIELLYLEYAGKQLDPGLLKRITAKSTAITQAFNVYRAKVDGKELPDSAVRKVLADSHDSAERRAVWEASKAVGAVIEKDLKELVGLRNEAARKLGYRNFYDMKLQLDEMDRAQVLKLFDELYDLTRGPFRAAKDEIDRKLAADYGIAVADLRPWHYHDPFFQEPPAVYNVDLDAIYAHTDVVKLAGRFWAGIGLPVDDVLARSDLYERPGKYPHAMCTDIDREGDIRVMANAVPSEQWMSTMLHELGHATYDKYIPRSLPWIVRTPAATFTTEAIAVMFDRLASQPGWMLAAGLQVPDVKAVAEANRLASRSRTLIFAAWSQVMVRFELGMYEDPAQDLNRLWWDLTEKYQLLRRPDGRNAPDYASKIHIVSSPAYYHSYMMGEMFASQLRRTIARDVLKTDAEDAVYNGHGQIGEFLKAKVYGPGASVRWDELVRGATGQDLGPKAMMEEVLAEATRMGG